MSQFLSMMSRYGGEMTLTDADGDLWKVGDDGDVVFEPGTDGDVELEDE